MIEFKLMTITPAIAAKWLEKNIGNRNPSPNTIAGYARDMIAGNWRALHQPLAFDADGKLIDGQNRLFAVIKSGCTIKSYVAFYDSRETIAKLQVDTQRRRTTDFILGCAQKDQETVRAILKYAGAGENPTNAEIDAVLTLHQPLIGRVSAIAGKMAKFRSSSSARAAIVLRCFESPADAEKILDQYKKFVMLEDVDQSWPSVLALLRYFDGVKSADRYEVFRRVWWAFCIERKSTKVARLGDIAAMMKEVRLLVSMFVGSDYVDEDE